MGLLDTIFSYFSQQGAEVVQNTITSTAPTVAGQPYYSTGPTGETEVPQPVEYQVSQPAPAMVQWYDPGATYRGIPILGRSPEEMYAIAGSPQTLTGLWSSQIVGPQGETVYYPQRTAEQFALGSTEKQGSFSYVGYTDRGSLYVSSQGAYIVIDPFGGPESGSPGAPIPSYTPSTPVPVSVGSFYPQGVSRIVVSPDVVTRDFGPQQYIQAGTSVPSLPGPTSVMPEGSVVPEVGVISSPIQAMSAPSPDFFSFLTQQGEQFGYQTQKFFYGLPLVSMTPEAQTFNLQERAMITTGEYIATRNALQRQGFISPEGTFTIHDIDMGPGFVPNPQELEQFQGLQTKYTTAQSAVEAYNAQIGPVQPVVSPDKAFTERLPFLGGIAGTTSAYGVASEVGFGTGTELGLLETFLAGLPAFGIGVSVAGLYALPDITRSWMGELQRRTGADLSQNIGIAEQGWQYTGPGSAVWGQGQPEAPAFSLPAPQVSRGAVTTGAMIGLTGLSSTVWRMPEMRIEPSEIYPEFPRFPGFNPQPTGEIPFSPGDWRMPEESLPDYLGYRIGQREIGIGTGPQEYFRGPEIIPEIRPRPEIIPREFGPEVFPYRGGAEVLAPRTPPGMYEVGLPPDYERVPPDYIRAESAIAVPRPMSVNREALWGPWVSLGEQSIGESVPAFDLTVHLPRTLIRTSTLERFQMSDEGIAFSEMDYLSAAGARGQVGAQALALAGAGAIAASYFMGDVQALSLAESMAVAGGIGLADVTAETLADSLAYAADIAQAEAIVTVSDLAMVQPTVYESPVLYMPEYLPQNPIAWDYYNFPGGKPWEEPGRRRELLWPLMDTSWIGSGRLGSMEEVFPLGALWSDPFGLLKTAKGRKKRKR